VATTDKVGEFLFGLRNMSAAKTVPSVLAYGELLWDVLPGGAVLGGAPANFAYRLHTLGRRALTVSKVGRDELGERALTELRARGVDISLIQQDETFPTGTVNVTLNGRGDASYVINRGVAYDQIEATAELMAAAQQCSILYFGSLIQRERKSCQTLETILAAAPQAVRLLDLNLRRDCYTQETIESSLRHADILKLNEDEVQIVTTHVGLGVNSHRDFAMAMRKRFGVKSTIITLAARGVYGWSDEDSETLQPGYVVTVADTIGSGDSFTAAFVDAHLSGRDLGACCEAGNRLGALVAGKKGGMCSITPEEIAVFNPLNRASARI
jgi:fructokinase